MNKWQIGDVKITRIVEVEATGGSKFILPEATPEECKPISWMAPHFMDADGKLKMSVHALAIEAGDRRIIVDTCIGNDKERAIPDWNMRTGPFLNDLAEAGFAPDSIDTVMCTHLHVDHVGWNTILKDGKWVPTFTNARYLVAEDEWKYWDTAEQDGFGPVIEDSVRPIVDAGLCDFVPSTHKICDEIWLEPTPGHTPGHVSVRISSKSEDALITGDFIHHPCQFARPEWASSADYDAKQAKKTRETVFAKYADQPTLIIGTHFATPSAGHLKKDGDVYRLDVV